MSHYVPLRKRTHLHLEKIIQETGVTPAINQVELHPYFPQAKQRAWDKVHGIVTQAWSPARAGEPACSGPDDQGRCRSSRQDDPASDFALACSTRRDSAAESNV